MNYVAYEQDSVSLDEYSPFLEEHLSRYLWVQSLVKNQKVLDCACGKGYGSFLMSLEARSVVGVDLNSSSLEIAKNRFQKNNLEFKTADVLSLDKSLSKQSFDVVIAFEIIEHLLPSEMDRFFMSLQSVLKPDGILILSTPNHDVVLKSGVKIPDFHINNLKPVELKKLIQSYFKELKMLGQYRQRSPLQQLLFDYDYFNLRHLLKGIAKSKINANEMISPSTFQRVDSSFLVNYSKSHNRYDYSPRHWRQAGLTVAIARGKCESV